MELEYYHRINNISSEDILNYPELLHDNLFKSDVIRALIEHNMIDILIKMDIEKEDISYLQISNCRNVELLEILSSYIVISDYVINLAISKDNMVFLKYFEIDINLKINVIEDEIPYNIIKSIINTETRSILSYDDIFTQGVLTNNYEICELVIDYTSSHNLFWRTIISTENSKIVDLYIEKKGMPVKNSVDLISIAVLNGHLGFLEKSNLKKYTFNFDLLSKLLMLERFEDVDKLCNLCNFSDDLDSHYFFINLEGYNFYKDKKGFCPEIHLYDLIENKKYELIDKICDDFPISPSIDYAIKAIEVNCHYTLFTVFNRLVSPYQIRNSVDYLEMISFTNRRCFLTYYRICKYYAINIPNLYGLAIKYDCVSALLNCNYDKRIALKHSIKYNSPRVFKFLFKPNLSFSEDFLSKTYKKLSTEEDFTILYTLVKIYGVPKRYINKNGKRGSLKLISDYRNIK